MLRISGSSLNQYVPDMTNGELAACSQDAAAYSDRAPTPTPKLAFSIDANTFGPLAAKLSLFALLGPAEISALAFVSRNVRNAHAGQIIVHEDSVTDHICLMVEGLACRYKMLPGGRRQILGYLIPGDVCDTHYALVNRPDHSLATLCDSKIVQIPVSEVNELAARFPRIGSALSLAALADTAILREWLLSVGQRGAVQRLGHFLCEMEARLKAVGRVDRDGSFDLPVNQTTLADTIGLTPVHTNRIIQQLRRAGLICLRHRRLTILDRPRLIDLAGFDENYLHLRGHRV